MARILVVDDDVAGRQLLVTLMQFRGHESFQAADGADALAAVREYRPQLVISDLLMPTMDGYEFLRRLRADPELAATRVMFYTASYHEREALNLAESGHATHVLVKPSEPDQILKAIDEALLGQATPPRHGVPSEFDTQHLRLVTDKLWLRTTELEAANARLAALTDLHVQLASEREPHALLREVCKSARKLFGARFAVLAAREKGGSGGTYVATSGLEARDELHGATRLDSGKLGQVASTRTAWREDGAADATPHSGLPSGYPPASSMLAVPIVSLSESYGWICLADKVGASAFSEDDERLLANLGAQVGRIYENGSLNSELQRRARLLQEEIAQRKQAALSLRLSEERFRQLAENIQDAFFVTTSDLGNLAYLSPAYSQIWGTPPPSGCRCVDALMQAIHPEDEGRVASAFKAVTAGDAMAEIEYRILRPDREARCVQVRTFPVTVHSPAEARIVGTATDVTENRQAAARIEHLNRVYAVLSGINTLIVRVRDRDELFKEACRLAVKFGRFAMAWIGWLEPKTGIIAPRAWAGESHEILGTAMSVLGPDPEDDGLAAAAIRSGEPQIINDIATDARRIVIRDEMVARGFRGMVALPLVLDDMPMGCLVFVTVESDFFSDEEMRLLLELADDISFAIDHLEKADKLYYLAYYDAVTGLANRTLFLDRLAQNLAHATKAKTSLAVVAMAPERLGNINDTFGRPAGDLVVRQFAERFADATDGTVLGRVAGDQIATLVEVGDDESEILAKVSRWQEDCFGRPFDIHGTPMRLGATTGIAIFPDDGQDAASLLKNAEAALERAKSTGDEHLFYTQRMSVAVTEKLLLEQSLREALDKQEFELHYQPKVDIERRQIRGIEALIRWRSAEHGLVPPTKFIPLMEETGLIVPVGSWVIRQAAEDRSRWRRKGILAPRVAVNVSTIQIRKRDFVQTVRAALREAGNAPGIDFEVTESLIMEDVDGNIQKLAEVTRMGIRIALDDFGTGYSSLGYLAKLPVEILKIDRSFIMKMLDDPGAMTLVSTMISLAHSLKLNVVAEGVESEEQAKILRLLRCDEIQGYLVSKPLPFDAMTDLLKQSRG